MIRNSMYFLAGRVPTAIIGLLSLYVITRLLDQADYGRYSVILAISGLISSFGFQWLRQSLVKFGSDPKCNRKELLGTIGLLSVAPLTVTIVIAMLLDITLHDNSHINNSSLIVATILLAVSQAWFELGSDAIRVDMNPIKYGIAGVLRSAFCLAFGLLGHWLTETLFGMVVGVALGYLLAQMLTAPNWLHAVFILNNANRTQLKEVTSYGLPLSLTLGFAVIIDSADRLMLAAIVNAEESGIYSSAYNLGQFALGTVLGALGLAIFPSAVKCYATRGANRTEALLGQNLLLLIGFALPITLGLMAISPTLTTLMLGNFAPDKSALITAIVLVGVALSGIRAFAYDIAFMLAHKTQQQAAILGAAAGLNISLNLFLIPTFGAMGAASATLMSFGFALGLSAYFGRKLIRVKFRYTDVLKITISSCVMVATVLIIPLENTWNSILVKSTTGISIYLLLILIINPSNVRRKLISRFRERV